MKFCVCISLPVFLGKTSTNSTPEQNSEAQKVYAHDALTNVYIQCVENKMPVRKAVKLYNIPHTALRDRLSGRVHVVTLLKHIETVLFFQILYCMKVECCLNPILKFCLALILSF